MKLDLVDVFAGTAPLTGNPLAVVHDGAWLSDAQMLGLCNWLGFSETTFLLPPTEAGADYRVRIFCPGRELPFAGHPTLGTAWAWLAAGGKPAREGVVVQQCGVGLVEVRVDEERLAFRAPPLIRSGPLTEPEIARALDVLTGVLREDVIEAVWADNGPGWQLLRLESARKVLEVGCAAKAPQQMDIGLVGPSERDGVDWEVRAFFTIEGGILREDPVTGSLNASIGQVLFSSGLARGGYVAAQGQKAGGDGRVLVTEDGEDVWVGGRVEPVSLGGALGGF
jgi:PhzF family phenazine biosynthesis protein